MKVKIRFTGKAFADAGKVAEIDAEKAARYIREGVAEIVEETRKPKKQPDNEQ